jgi:4-hydroxybenzoate polyprenyltransferase
MKTLTAIFITMRPYQWVKNLVFFTALIFGGKLSIAHDVVATVIGFFLFCLLSSAVYLLNDAKDCELDRQNPEKRTRPVASGELKVSSARVASFVLTAFVFLAAFSLPVLDPEIRGFGFGICLVLYYVQNLLYTWFFKQEAVLDVISISVGFVLRIEAGGFLIGAPISDWALICTFFLSLFLGLGKRRYELSMNEADDVSHRPALKDYHPALVDQMLTVVLSATIVAYAIYTVSDKAKELTENLYYSLIFVVYGLFRYLYLIHKHEKGGDPTRTLVSDLPMLITIFLWGVTVVACIYLFPNPPAK